jgi:pectate lyase
MPTRRRHGVLLITLSALLAASSLRGDAPEGVSFGQGSGAREGRDLLLARHVGFGRNAAGGLTGATHHVTTAADNGPGSLREALPLPEPLRIVFDGDYTIALSSGLKVGSHKTIGGRGRRVTLTGHNAPGLVIDGAGNVVVENLILRDFGDTARSHHR